MLKTLANVLREVPGSGVLCALAVAAVVLALVMLVSTVRTLRAGRAPSVGQWCSSLASVAIVPVSTLHSAQTGRAMIQSVIEQPSRVAVDERARTLAAGISATLEAIPFGLTLLWGPSLLLGSAAVALTLHGSWAARARPRGSAAAAGGAVSGSWDVLLFVMLWAGAGFFIAVLGATSYCTKLIVAFGAMAGASAEDKASHLVSALSVARDSFGSWYGGALGVIALITVGAALVLARGTRVGSSGAKDVLGGCTCLLLAGLLFMATEPYRAENGSLLPRSSVNAPTQDDVRLPALEGPDEIEIAPVLGLVGGRTKLDGREVAGGDALAQDLGTLKRNWALLHPGGTFPGRLVVLVEPEVPVARLQPLLISAHGAGYDVAQLAFGGYRTFDQPVLGRLRRGYFSAAFATLVLEPPADADPSDVMFKTGDFTRYEELAREVVEARKAERKVILVLATAPAPAP